MTVAWQSIKAAFVAFIAACGVVPPEHVYFQHEAHPLMQDDTVELAISAESAVGYDDLELVEQPDGRLVPRITGSREFTLSIRFQTRNEVIGARTALETVRASFHHPTRLAILENAGIGFLRTEMLQSFDDVFADRYESIAVLDVRFTVVSELYDPTEPGIETLLEVGVSTKIAEHPQLDQTFTVTE